MPSTRPRTAGTQRTTRRSASHATLALAFLWLVGPVWAVAQTGESPVPWSQFQGGPEHSGIAATAPQPPYRQAWAFPAPEGSLSGAVIAGAVAIAVGENAVFGIDLATGDERWRLTRQGGPIAMPALGVADGKGVLLYTEEDAGGENRLVAVDLKTRDELWPAPLEAASRSGITVDGGTVFVGDDEGNLYAVDLATGDIRWTVQTVGAIQSPPSAAGGVVYAVGIDTDGGRVEVISVRASDGTVIGRITPRAPGATASATASAKEGVFVTLADRLVHALDPELTADRWTSLLNSVPFPFSGPAAAGDDVFVADLAGGLYRVSAADGERIWSYQFNELIARSSPVVVGSSVVIGLNDGRLVAVDVDAGHLVWQSRPSPGLIAAIAASPDVLVALKGGRHVSLVGFQHDPDGRLVDVESPTTLRPGTVLSRFGIAFAVVAAVVLVPSILLSRRVGLAPPLDEEGTAGTDDGPEEEAEPERDVGFRDEPGDPEES